MVSEISPMRTLPWSKFSSPLRQRSKVDLPHPDGPMITVSSEVSTEKLISCSARAPP